MSNGAPWWIVATDQTSIMASSASTAGISRNMQAPYATGGGDLNGSSTTVLMLGQAGTAGVRIAVPRQAIKAGGGNYCGVV